MLVNLISDYRRLLGQGVVARFDPATYSDAVAFARIGEGSLGGKARGLAFMNSMLIKHRQYDMHEGVRIMIPRSVVIATEYFDEFIRLNGLKYIISQEFSDEEILSEFVSSYVPPRLQQELKAYIRTVRTPLAVRSSSKLEDSHYQPFAGIYSTYMIPYTDNEDQMLRLLLRAVKSVYASVYFAASRAYIQSSQNLISEEKMAVIIQEVCGTEQDGLFFPTCSGVARSINYYPIGDERPEDGVCNVAMGLGKLVVDGGRTLRFSPRYPQKVLQTSTPELALRDTQNEVLALSLRPEEFRTSIDDAVNLRRLSLQQIAPLRNARFVCSVWDRENERISDSPFDRGRKVITFNNILKYNTFPLAEIVSDILRMGAEEMRCPVEVEFAVNMDVAPGQQRIFNLLQIRPIIDNQDNRPIDWSAEDPARALVYGEQALGIGRMTDIADIVYVKSGAFDSLSTERIADELLALNTRMRDEGRPMPRGAGPLGLLGPVPRGSGQVDAHFGGEGDRRMRPRTLRGRAFAGHALLPERHLARRGVSDDQPLPRRRHLPRGAARRPHGRLRRNVPAAGAVRPSALGLRGRPFEPGNDPRGGRRRGVTRRAVSRPRPARTPPRPGGQPARNRRTKQAPDNRAAGACGALRPVFMPD